MRWPQLVPGYRFELLRQRRYGNMPGQLGFELIHRKDRSEPSGIVDDRLRKCGEGILRGMGKKSRGEVRFQRVVSILNVTRFASKKIHTPTGHLSFDRATCNFKESGRERRVLGRFLRRRGSLDHQPSAPWESR